ncbi:MAG TPA: CDGSH iron-sulfur domain-containing protein [Kofleriaceae bacterium]
MTKPIEEVRGKTATIVFDASKCIHSRHCVLDRPDVFVPNVDGEWIHPDAATADEVAELAHNCPSGAINYIRHDGKPQESPPIVNTVRVRENGPLAFHAELVIDGQPAGFRATLCRCGRSARKPYCDGSHAGNFTASGEITTKESKPLAARDGVVSIDPSEDGPLLVTGSLEVVTGTGRTVDRCGKTALCRCGASANKPFCDGTHKSIGFRAARGTEK